MYYIRVWYKDQEGKVFHQDHCYPEPMEVMRCIPYRAEILENVDRSRYEKYIDIVEQQKRDK